MTQEQENSAQADAKAPKSSPAPKKVAATKTPAKNSAAPKSTAKSAVKKATAKTEKTEPAAKKTPAKPAAKKPVAKKPAAETETAKTESAEAPAKKTAVKAATATKKPVAAKKTAAAKAEKAETAKPKTSKAASKTSPAKTTAKEEQPVAAPAEKVPGDTVAPAKPAPKKSTAPRSKATAKKAEPAAMPETAAKTEIEAKPAPEAADSETAQQQPRSSSRRSRRGGRRRNKKNAQGALSTQETVGIENEAGEAGIVETKAPAAAEKPEQPIDDDAQKNKKPESQGKGSAAKKDAAPKGSLKGVSKKAEPEPQPAKASSGKRKMFISVLSGELVEVVLAEEGQVQEYYVEMQHQAKVKGNIYKGVVSNIDANLQAAFVSYAGGVKNGFLQIDEVHPEYYVMHHDPAKGRKYPPIQKVLKPGQEILVQVVKEPAGTKGAFLTSYLSLPGRFLVLTPGREQVGVSRKVDDDTERSRLRTILDGLSVGAGLGVIVRTVSTGSSKTNISRDLQFLKRLWKEVRAKGQMQPAPSLIYEELDLSTRAVRDYLTDDVQEVWVDDEATAKQVTELAALLFPKKQNLVQVHHEMGHSLFERFSLQKQLDQIHSREVGLPSGGRLAIDNTEALTAIDINSGRSNGKSNFEDMAYRTNLEAAKAIPLQLRLRDIGGQVVVDFIEMRDRDHWREVEKAVRNGMKGDRARYDVGKIGPFGMLEIVRQRLGSSAISISTEPCPCCKGTGIRRNMEWQAMQSLRDIGRSLRQAAANQQISYSYAAEAELAFYLLNTKRSILQRMEEEVGVTLSILPASE
ncbi:MAG: Ribonuclease E [Desulfovibrio sp.]